MHSMDQARLQEVLLYSPRKGVFYWIKPPAGHADLLGEEAGCVNLDQRTPYHVIQIDGVKHKRSRLAYLYMTGRMPEFMIDHINGVSVDDRWANLRPATPLENARNVRRNNRNNGLPMGVRKNPSGNFAARISVNGEQVSLGTFPTAQLAEAAYREARVRYFGEFA